MLTGLLLSVPSKGCATEISRPLLNVRATVPRREVKDLEQLITPALAMLSIEPAAEIRSGVISIRRAAVAEDVAVKLFDAETRLQQRA